MKSKKIVLGVILALSLSEVTSLANINSNKVQKDISAEENNIVQNNIINSVNANTTNIIDNSVYESIEQNVNNSNSTDNINSVNSQNTEKQLLDNDENNLTENSNSLNTVTEEQEQSIYSMENAQKMITKAEKTKENGVYKISIGADINKTIEIAGSDTGNNAKVDIWDYGNATAQKFYLSYDEEGFYKITAMHTGKSLTVKDGNLIEGAEIVQYNYQGLDSQKWIVRDSNKNGWVISPISNPELSISVQGNIENASKLILSKTEDNDKQMFYMYNISEDERTKEDGIFKIAIGIDPNKTIEIAGSSTENNAKVDIWNYGNATAQKFYLSYDEEGFYKITAMHTGKSLTASINNSTGMLDVVQYEYQGLDSQKWLIKDSGKNGWVISLLSNPLVSITVSGNVKNGAKLIMTDTKNNNNQMFYMYNLNNTEKTKENGNYEILVGADSNKSIEIAGSSTANNAKVDIWDYGNVPAQKFDLQYVNGYYKIMASHTGKCLTVKDNNLTEGADIVQYEYQGLDSQKWIIRDSGKNGWVISLLSNPNLSISIEGSIVNGAKMILSQTKNNDNQMFYVVKTVDVTKTKDNGTYNLAVGKDSTKSIEVAGSSTENNAKVDIWSYGNVAAQKFEVEYMDGFYKITAGHSGKSLTVKNNNVTGGAEIVQDEYKGEIGQMWIIRDSNINGWVISPVLRPDMAITIENKISNGSKLVLENLKYNDRQMFYFYKANLGVSIDTNKYPGISEAVNELVAKHPNWQFEVLYTGLDFNTAVQGEYDYAGKTANLVDMNTYSGEWIAPNPVIDSGWASASYKAIAYYMDPRNILNDIDVFQFVDLADYSASGATYDSIQYQVSGTFLDGYTQDVMNACQATNINPYFVLARLFQEQGYQGSGTINMDGGDGKLYYNPFNIGAEVGDEINTALAKAKQEGWDTMQKGLEGGIKVLKEGYIDAKQNTLYLNKFDVNPASPGGFYSHQYMQNLSAAYSEARIFRGAYEDTGTLDNNIKFIIPVYENMPTKPSEIPRNEVTSSGPISVQVKQTDMGLALRSEPSTQGGDSTLVGSRLPTGTQLISIERLDNGWHKVITLDGRMGYCSNEYNEYLEIIDDITNCNDRVIVDTNDNIGTNVRTEPGIDQSYILKAVVEGSTGTRIMKNVYYADGHSWDIVIFDDGTRGFVATDYLKVI